LSQDSRRGSLNEAKETFGDLIFRASLAVVSVLLALIRFYYGWQAAGSGAKILYRRAGKVRTILVWMLGILAASASVLWVIAPGWMAWAAIPLPMVLRWSGITVGAITVLLFFWVHRTLGENWAMPGEIKERQTLMTTGAYRWVRHPMYTTLFVWALAYFLMSANVFIGLAWLGLGIVAAAMVGDEEAALLETFGEIYQTYLQEVGRFWPRWG
jgi:protein-S-isoprenylcysteine O-methyltransferase Ste14